MGTIAFREQDNISSTAKLELNPNTLPSWGDDFYKTLEREAAEAVTAAYERTAVDPYNRNTTDIVRLYLIDIGRVPLLSRDEEVAEAQKVQSYARLRELLATAASQGDGIIRDFVRLLEIDGQRSGPCREHLLSCEYSPSPKQWAAASEVEVSQLKEILARGKRRWAEIAECDVRELEQIQKAGIRAKNHMIKANLRLVVSVAKKYQNRGLELLDMIQEGTLGLERAVDKFEPIKGFRFSTYAYWWIRQGITRAIATQSRNIRIPVHITEKLNKIKKATGQISQEKGRTASIEEIAEKLELTPGQVREALQRVPRSVSLEIKVGKDKDRSLGDLLVTDKATPEEVLIQEGLKRELKHLMADLTSREREVLQMRYGLIDGKFYSLSEIALLLKLSRERVRQVETKALQKLRQPKCRNRLRDYLHNN